MILLVLITLICILTVVGTFVLVKGQFALPRDPRRLSSLTVCIDLKAFENLNNPAEIKFIESMVSRKQGSALERERKKVLLAYLNAIGHNAAVLLRIGELAREGGQPEYAEASSKLAQDALRIRILILQAVIRTRISLLVPRISLNTSEIVCRYEAIRMAIASTPALKVNTALDFGAL